MSCSLTFRSLPGLSGRGVVEPGARSVGALAGPRERVRAFVERVRLARRSE